VTAQKEITDRLFFNAIALTQSFLLGKTFLTHEKVHSKESFFLKYQYNQPKTKLLRHENIVP
jgi:hypothetical protein